VEQITKVLRKIRKKCIAFGFLSCTVFQSAYAGIDSDLHSFFNDLGFSSNVTAPNAYKGQLAGYYTGGSIFARNSVRNYQIAQITLPDRRSGCGGIDLFMGGFSFIDAQQFIESMKNILNNAAGYAFMLALESATAEIANVTKYMQDAANKINAANINSCETAIGLVGSAWPRTAVAQQKICADIGSSKGIFTDYAAARQGCGAGGQISSTLNQGKTDERYKNLILDNTNIAWKAINQNDFLNKDPQLAEFFMSLSGSIIVKKEGEDDNATNKFIPLPSLASDPSLLKALMHGDKTNIYVCDETSADGCLNPYKKEVTIARDKSLVSQISAMLNSIAKKIYSDTPLSSEEIGFLNSTRLPVYKMLNVQAAYYRDSNTLDIDTYSDIIAADILFQYLDEALGIVKASTANLQYPDHIMQQFIAGIASASSKIRTSQQTAYHQISSTVQLIQQTQVLEQMLNGELSTTLGNNLEWARGVK
jgi:conjugative transfer pilus assembly protein TraH